MIEKHLTFSCRMYDSDASHSLEPDEFAELVNGIRAVETILTSPVDKDAKAAELTGMKTIFEKSVVSLVEIPAGTVVSADMLAVKKPGTGIVRRTWVRKICVVIGSRTNHSSISMRPFCRDRLPEFKIPQKVALVRDELRG